MARKLTPKQVAEARKMASRQVTQAAIGRKLGVSAPTVARALAAADVEAGAVLRRRRHDRRAATSTEALPRPKRADRDADALAARVAAIPEHDKAAATELRDVLDAARRLRKKAETDGAAADFARLCRLEADLAVRLAELEPPKPKDPATDPAHLASRDALLRLVEGLVVEAEGERADEPPTPIIVPEVP
jgi:hypothetical protein